MQWNECIEPNWPNELHKSKLIDLIRWNARYRKQFIELNEFNPIHIDRYNDKNKENSKYLSFDSYGHQQ